MLSKLDKIKLKLFGRFKGKDGYTLAERTLHEAIRCRDLKTLAYLKEQNISETIGKRHALAYADFTTTRQMMALGYGSTLQKDEKKKLVLNNIRSDRHAFEDPEAVTFCRRLELSMGLTDKNGNNILLKGQTTESIQMWAEQAHLNQVNAEFVAAAARGDADMLRILNRSGKVSIDSRVNGTTAVAQSIVNGQEKTALWLLRHGAKMAAPAQTGAGSPFQTPKGKTLAPKLLVAAVQLNLMPAARDMLDAGVSPDNPDLMLIAAENNNEKMLALLHQKGAASDKAFDHYDNRYRLALRSETEYDDQAQIQALMDKRALLGRYLKKSGRN